jgi:hypothetical protein
LIHQEGAKREEGMNPDSAVPADAMSEEQTFRSEVNGSLPYEINWFQLFQKFQWFQRF